MKWCTVGALLLAALPARADGPPAGQLKALVKQYEEARDAWMKVLREEKPTAERRKQVLALRPLPEKYAAGFLALAEKHPKDTAAVEALVWVATNVPGLKEDSPRNKALDVLQRDHLRDARLGAVCARLATATDRRAGEFLRAARDKGEGAELKAEATLALAQHLQNLAAAARRLNGNAGAARPLDGGPSPEASRRLRDLDADKTAAEAKELFARFVDKHAADLPAERVAVLCRSLAGGVYGDGDALLRALAEKDTRRAARGAACLALAELLKDRADAARRLRDEAAAAGRYAAFYGKEAVARVKALDPAELRRESIELFEEVAEKYADLEQPFRGKFGGIAANELFEMIQLAVGKPAPEIEAEDLDGKAFKLSDYKGKVVLLDFWGHW